MTAVTAAAINVMQLMRTMKVYIALAQEPSGLRSPNFNIFVSRTTNKVRTCINAQKSIDVSYQLLIQLP